MPKSTMAFGYIPPISAHWNQFVLEIDFDNLAAYDRFWREWVSIDSPTFDERYKALVEHDISNEIWDLTT